MASPPFFNLVVSLLATRFHTRPTTRFSELKRPLTQTLDAVACGHMIAHGFENRPLIRSRVGQFDQRLEDLVEQGVALAPRPNGPSE